VNSASALIFADKAYRETLCFGNKRDRPFAEEEIKNMRYFLKRLAPASYRRMFGE
jgi:hypothetical protein